MVEESDCNSAAVSALDTVCIKSQSLFARHSPVPQLHSLELFPTQLKRVAVVICVRCFAQSLW